MRGRRDPSRRPRARPGYAFPAIPCPPSAPRHRPTMTDRVASLEKMLATRPDDARLRFGLALEYEKAGRIEDAIGQLEAYLERSEDEGNAWGRLGGLLRRAGRTDAARRAYTTGIEQARKHGHPSMAADLEAALEDE